MAAQQNHILETLGVTPLINASGTLTSLGGTRTRRCATQAMADIAGLYVDLAELHRKAGQRIAALLGVEAACVTNSASAGLVQSAAACMAGSDLSLQAALPTAPRKHKIVTFCTHRNPFDRCLRIPGAELVVVGDAIETPLHDLESVLDEQTAAVAFFLQAQMLDASPTLQDTLAVAHRRSIPVIVDAAAELPPKSNLWSLAQAGADLVIFSGGKDIGGPQSSGLVVGRADLVEAARMQGAPFELVVARSMKAGKETVVGLLAALEEYLQEDEAARLAAWEAIATYLLEAINRIPGLSARRLAPCQPKIQPATLPRLAVTLAPPIRYSLPELAAALRRGNPPIAVECTRDFFWINTHTLTLAEAEVVVARLEQLYRTG